MMRAFSNDPVFLATRLHARRSRMAEAGRLDALCRIRNLPELGRATHPGVEFPVTADYQRRLVQDLAGEISGCLQQLGGAERNFIGWLQARFQLENLKVLLRGFLNHRPLAELQPHLVELPADLALDAGALMEAKTLDEFTARLPAGVFRDRLLRSAAGDRNSLPSLFILEAALDAGYLTEFSARTSRLPGDEREIVTPMVVHEVNFFHFMLAVRGRFHFNLAPEVLLPLGAGGCDVRSGWFNVLLSAPDLLTAANSAVGMVIDALPSTSRPENGPSPVDVSALESLAWKRFLRLANRAFRRSHLGVGAVAGYFGVRRVETANLITLSEGVRLGVDEHECRARMISQTEPEVAHV